MGRAHEKKESLRELGGERRHQQALRRAEEEATKQRAIEEAAEAERAAAQLAAQKAQEHKEHYEKGVLDYIEEKVTWQLKMRVTPKLHACSHSLAYLDTAYSAR